MIECEICGKYFHGDDIERCPNCDIELCPSCYEEHNCMLIDMYEEEASDIPHECPECGEELELDIDYDKQTLICNNCDYVLDVTGRIGDDEVDE